MPKDDPLHERLEFPELPVIMFGERPHERLAEFVAAVRPTVPLNPPSGEILTTEVVAVLAIASTLVGPFTTKS